MCPLEFRSLDEEEREEIDNLNFYSSDIESVASYVSLLGLFVCIFLLLDFLIPIVYLSMFLMYILQRFKYIALNGMLLAKLIVFLVLEMMFFDISFLFYQVIDVFRVILLYIILYKRDVVFDSLTFIAFGIIDVFLYFPLAIVCGLPIFSAYAFDIFDMFYGLIIVICILFVYGCMNGKLLERAFKAKEEFIVSRW